MLIAAAFWMKENTCVFGLTQRERPKIPTSSVSKKSSMRLLVLASLISLAYAGMPHTHAAKNRENCEYTANVSPIKSTGNPCVAKYTL